MFGIGMESISKKNFAMINEMFRSAQKSHFTMSIPQGEQVGVERSNHKKKCEIM